jgi:hypothetical protein
MQTVYELSWLTVAAALLPGLFFVVASTLLWISQRRGEREFRRGRFIVCWIICLAIGICWVVVAGRIGYEYKTALRTGQCRVVEGTVRVLEKWGKAHPERIQIGDQVFSYHRIGGIYDYLSYHWIIVDGGPLTNGVYARLRVFDEDNVHARILQVEIKP